MKLIYTLPFYIRSEPDYRENDVQLAVSCLTSLQKTDNVILVVYNQGCLDYGALLELLSSFQIDSIILGNGNNVGIAESRQACFEYIWENYKDANYIAEIHLDMMFPKDWHIPIIDCLMNSDEPAISASIINVSGELMPSVDGISRLHLPQDEPSLMQTLKSLECEGLIEGFTHPVIHKSEVLKMVGGYDYRFLKGKQGYEDDSLLLGYLYYMGLRTQWRPKCCLKSRVYHAAMAQRMTLEGKENDFMLNLNGLYHQYGGYGFKHLSHIYNKNPTFKELFQSVIQQLD